MKNYEAWDLEIVDASKVSTEELYRNLIGWAVLAANAHNVQPWRFIARPNERTIDVCVDPGGILPASDKSARQAHISVGCAIENLMLAADYYGLTPQLQFLGIALYPMPIARFSFGVPAGNSFLQNKINLIAVMRLRKMNRGQYLSDRPIQDEHVAEIKKAAEDSGVAMNMITDVTTRFAIAEIQYTADLAVIGLTSFRKELGQFLLPNDTTSGKGMPGNTFGLSDQMAAHVHRELNKDGPFDPDLATGVAASGRDGIRSAPLLGVICVEKDEPEYWLKSGRAFERITLIAESYGLAIAVHAAMVEVKMFNLLLKARLGTLKRPTVIFRMGYPKEERPHSPRLPIEDVAEFIH